MAKNGRVIPEYDIESLARCLFPEIQKFFQSDEGKREFEVWKAKQSKTENGGD